jgi:hypothetical protein
MEGAIMTRARAEKKPAPATADEVRAIVGGISEEALASVLATGANAAEVLEAHTWLNADDVMGAALKRPLHGAVAAVLDILEEDLEPPEDTREGRAAT